MPLLLAILVIWAALVLIVVALCLAAARGSRSPQPDTAPSEPSPPVSLPSQTLPLRSE